MLRGQAEWRGGEWRRRGVAGNMSLIKVLSAY